MEMSAEVLTALNLPSFVWRRVVCLHCPSLQSSESVVAAGFACRANRLKRSVRRPPSEYTWVPQSVAVLMLASTGTDDRLLGG